MECYSFRIYKTEELIRMSEEELLEALVELRIAYDYLLGQLYKVKMQIKLQRGG